MPLNRSHRSSLPRQFSPRALRGAGWLVCLLGCWLGMRPVLGQSPSASASQPSEIKIWEFSPYEVQVWYAFDPSVTVSAIAKQRFVHELEHQLDRTFRAAWRTQLTEMAPQIRGQVTRGFEHFTLDDLTAMELVLVVSEKHPETKTLRTFEAAVTELPRIYTLAESRQVCEEAAANLDLEPDSATARLLAKLSVEPEGFTALREKLIAGEIAAALVPRSAIDAQDAELRPVVTPLPWQSEILFRKRDKLFLLVVGMQGDEFVLRAREIDCAMQFVGPSFQAASFHWPSAAQLGASTLVRCFAPIARVEDAQALTAGVRQRAGGLIVDERNPARLRIGDVLQPIVRRDDRNGVPSLLEPLAFTYAAVTASDGVKMEVNVYTYSGGPGLQGRQNRRTQRVLLRVRPVYEQCDLKIAVRGSPASAQAGCFVYQRHLLTDEFNLLGRTDWRGRLTIAAPQEPVGILPPAIRAERLKAKREAEQLAREKEEAAKAAAIAASSGDATTPAEATPQTPPAAVAKATDPDVPDEAVIPLNHPLVHIYIKNGDTVLAKLPIVPGLSEVEVAELPDDSLRLQSEAFVRGFQGEILDLIGLRNLLAARVKLHLKDQKLTEARGALDELRRLRSYNEMRDELSRIQRRMLEASGDSVPRASRARIDRMFQTTRDMLQKYLQDNLVAETERLVSSAEQGGVAADST